jgi:hypothetical protein
MYNAPSVSYPVGRCAFQRWVLFGLTVLSCVVLVAWASQQPMGWAWWMAAACWLVAVGVGGYAYAFDYSQVMGTLTWSGQVWCLHGLPDSADDMLGEVSVCMDVQGALLLKWKPLSDVKPAATRWLWLGAENSPKVWQDLRCAVFASSHAS